VTLDAGFDAERFVPLLEPGPFRVQRWTSSDIAADADNDWGDAAVVDGHVHMGWDLRLLRKHATGILAYLDTRMTNGPVEGINNKLRVIARRAYGFHSAGALTSMLFLCCGGIELAHPYPQSFEEIRFFAYVVDALICSILNIVVWFTIGIVGALTGATEAAVVVYTRQYHGRAWSRHRLSTTPGSPSASAIAGGGKSPMQRSDPVPPKEPESVFAEVLLAPLREWWHKCQREEIAMRRQLRDDLRCLQRQALAMGALAVLAVWATWSVAEDTLERAPGRPRCC